jgi:pimeloyl-ACP methyl ester carboxylesterase
MIRWIVSAWLVGLSALPISAATLETRIPLHDGQLELPVLSAHLTRAMNLPAFEVVGQIDLRKMVGSRFISALDESLGKGCDFSITPDELVIAIDPAYLPRNVDSAKSAVRLFTALAAPESTARQNELYGLLMPVKVDENRPMVVLMHGLDCNRRNWCAMTNLLVEEGYQVTYFTYPSDQPLADSAKFFAQHMQALRETFPTMRVDIVAHSMGGLVAREYVEGPEYAGGIEHLILIAPPNHGSRWAGYRLALEAEEHYYLWRNEPNWNWTWMITDGLGEAGRDLKPDSEFLTTLNARDRRESVKYTIIAGFRHPAYRMAANAVDRTTTWIPDRISHWWGVRHCGRALENAANHLNEHQSDCDGPVSMASTELDGVDDHILLPADHTTLYYGWGDEPPAAWEAVRDRLAN